MASWEPNCRCGRHHVCHKHLSWTLPRRDTANGKKVSSPQVSRQESVQGHRFWGFK